MRNDLQQLEAELEAELSAFGHVLDAPPLDAGAATRIQSAVRSAVIQRRSQMRWRRVSTFAAAAAAVLAAVGLPQAGVAPTEQGDGLDAWVEAATESSTTFTMLYEGAEWSSDEQDLDALEGMEQSLEAFENLFGA